MRNYRTWLLPRVLTRKRCHLPYAFQRVLQVFPALCPGPGLPERIPLGQSPFLHFLRGPRRTRAFVRKLPRCRVGGGAQRLASVRRSNRTCSFPASGFHSDALRDAIEGIKYIKLTRPYSPYNLLSGKVFHPVLRHRLWRCERIRRTIQRSSLLKSFRTWAL